jgi:predicted DNA-binding transcriptional regulator AlpA
MRIYAHSFELETAVGRNKTRQQRRFALTPSPLAVPAAPERSLELDRVVSEAETAKIIGYSKDTLRREFRAGRAPPRVRLSGRRIGYRLSAIYSWLETHTEKPGATA